MDGQDSRRISSTQSQDVEDPLLDELHAAVAAASPVSGEEFRTVPVRVPKEPFDLEVAKPRAIAIERLYRLLRKEVPADMRAALGATVPILLAHGITPFYKAAQKPSGVWGMGYECAVDNKKCDTVAVVPESRKYDVVHAAQQLLFGIKAGGQIGIPAVSALHIDNAPLTVDLAGASVSATTDQQYAIALQCTFSVLEVQAGPVNAGGARWNIYRGRETIDTYQPLFQTILVPEGTKRLRFDIKTWIRGSARYFGLVNGREWIYPAVTFDVSLES